MTTAKRYDSVWDAIEEQPEAENLKIRAALMAELAPYIDQAGLTQAQAAAVAEYELSHYKEATGGAPGGAAPAAADSTKAQGGAH